MCVNFCVCVSVCECVYVRRGYPKKSRIGGRGDPNIFLKKIDGDAHFTCSGPKSSSFYDKTLT